MAMPPGITPITVTGKYVAADGTALKGYLIFTPSITAADSTDNAILPSVPYKVTLDASGAFSVALAATDDPQWNNTGWTYTVREVMQAERENGSLYTVTDEKYAITIPAASPGGTLDLADVERQEPAVLPKYLPLGGGTVTGDLTLSGGGSDLTVGGAANITGRITTAERLSTAGFLMPFGAKRGKGYWGQDASYRDLFSSGHGWTVGGTGTASSADDTNVFQRGSQSIRVTTNATTNQSNIRKTGLSAMDLTGKAIKVTFKVSDITHFDRAQVSLGTSNAYTNSVGFSFYTNNNANNAYVQSDEWITWVIPWAAISGATGTYSITAGVPSARNGFTDISFAMYGLGTGAFTYYLDAIEIVPDTSTVFPNGVISLTFDDSWQSPYTYAKPKMDALGYRGTFYTIVQNVGTSLYMTLAQKKALRDMGHEIAGHSFLSANHNATNGFASLTADTVDYDFVRLRMWLDQNGFDGRSFAYPKGHFEKTTDNVSIAEIASRYWQTSRTIAGGSYEHYHPAHPQKLRAVTGINDGSGLGGRTVTQLTASGGELDRIKGNGAWSIWTFHQFTQGATAPTDAAICSQNGFNTLMDAIAAKGIAVRPVSEVIDYYSVES